MHKNILIFIIIVVLILPNIGMSQTKSELEQKRSQAQDIINTTTELLEKTSTSRQNTLERLSILNRRLQGRRDIINTIRAEIRYIDNSISERQQKITNLESELIETRQSYARLINIAYRHRFSHQRLMFVLSARDFNQAYRRLKYLQQYGRSRKKQIETIQLLTSQIIDEIETLENQRREKEELLDKQIYETDVLQNETREQSSVVQNLQKRERQLKEELAKQEKVADALQKAIEELLRNETSSTDDKSEYELTPSERIISDQFQQNKGGLPWPIERGVVTGYFGEHPHPVLKGIKTQNNGIDISTVEDAEVYSVFEGIVRQVLTVPGSNNVVLLRHGNYLTVYSNLSQVYVRAGDRVDIKQLIGRVFNDSDENKSILHLEIWEENNKLDPMLWLSRQ